MNNANDIYKLQAIPARKASLGHHLVSFFKDTCRDFSRKTVKAFNWLNRNLEFGLMLVITYVSAIASVLVLLACIAWFLCHFCPVFFWEHFGYPEVKEIVLRLDGIPMLYQGFGALLALCLAFYIGRPFCAAVLSIQNCLINKNYDGIKSILTGVKEHIYALMHRASGFVLKCAVGTAVAYFVWHALQLFQ